jgi:CubicO group peptidase (beta-lactamase class C family)
MSLATLQGFSQAGLMAHAAQFHQLVDQRKMANVVTLVARHGEVVNLDAYGVLEVSAVPTVSVRNDTIYRYASMTKPITGAAMMMLFEEGKWKLDDPVEKHIPEFKDLKVTVKRGSPPVEQESKMTMAQLMSHSAGFGGGGDYAGVNMRKGGLKDMIDEIAKVPLFFQPGKEWRYGMHPAAHQMQSCNRFG